MHALKNIYSLNKISCQLILLAHLLELYKSDCWFNILLGGVTIFLSSHYVQVQNLHGHFPRFRMFRIQINKITRAVAIMQNGERPVYLKAAGLFWIQKQCRETT